MKGLGFTYAHQTLSRENYLVIIEDISKVLAGVT